MAEQTGAHLDYAREQALAVRAMYEVLEERFNGKTWSLHELMLGFTNDVGYVGRLLLSRDGTWPIDGDTDAELRHKLAESMWWLFVLADKLDIDLDEAFATTMRSIGDGLKETVALTTPPST